MDLIFKGDTLFVFVPVVTLRMAVMCVTVLCVAVISLSAPVVVVAGHTTHLMGRTETVRMAHLRAGRSALRPHTCGIGQEPERGAA